jgi:flagellar motor switch protein FliM
MMQKKLIECIKETIDKMMTVFNSECQNNFDMINPDYNAFVISVTSSVTASMLHGWTRDVMPKDFDQEDYERAFSYIFNSVFSEVAQTMLELLNGTTQEVH